MHSSPIILSEQQQVELDNKKAYLEVVRGQLKTEFFGIDRCIDSIIDSLKTWYLLPQVITRPPIIALWGMTGVGKTALVRSLVSHLSMDSVFLELQMDGFSTVTTYETTTVAGLLAQSGIQEGQPGIILLDEFQRFRTIDQKGDDLDTKRFPDVWMLLSDGKFPSDYKKLESLIEYLESLEWYDDQRAYDRAYDEAAGRTREKIDVKYQRRFNLMRSEAENIKRMLRRPESIKEIMTWESAKVRDMANAVLATKKNPPFDYSKCLIFVSGNLDEAFRMAESVDDCDTSADVFYQHTLKIGTPEIKAALSTRFKPEQIARLGNNHVIYPSLNEDAYMKLIRRTCSQYVAEVQSWGGITFSVDESVYTEIYANSVYPTQGTRPVFTSVHKIFGSPLSEGVFWAWENKKTAVSIRLDGAASALIFSSGEAEKRVHVDLEINARRKKYSDDFKALVAVHEAGHAIVYSVLSGRAPWEVAINVASFKGGYNLYKESFLCKQEVLDRIAVSMGGIAAEELVFGPNLRSTGCAGDVNTATTYAGMYVRRYAMDGMCSTVISDMSQLCIVDVKTTDDALETIVREQLERAKAVLVKHRGVFLDLANHLLREPKLDSAAVVALIGERIPNLLPTDGKKEVDVTSPYARALHNATATPQRIQIEF